MVREKALSLIQGLGAFSLKGFLDGLDNWLRESVVVIGEPVELLTDPVTMLEQIRHDGQTFGDCDDLAMLSASFLASLGLDVRFKAVFENPDGSFSHVFTEFLLPRQDTWIAFDPTIKHAPIYSGRVLTEKI